MCERQQIVSAHDLITKIPDELKLNSEQIKAVVAVLHLLSELLELRSPR